MQRLFDVLRTRGGASHWALWVCLLTMVWVGESKAQTNAPQGVTYVGGQLKIDELNVTLADVLNQVTTLTGVKFDIPAEANSQRMPILKVGPGPAREVLASLLSGSHLNYVIQQADGDPEKIQAVLIMAPEKKGAKPGETMQAAVNPYTRSAELSARVEEPPASASRPSPAANAAAAMPASDGTPDQLAAASPAQMDGSSAMRPGALSPPAVLNPQSINQQLQQMYQQRMQINQQNHQAPPPGPPSLNMNSN